MDIKLNGNKLIKLEDVHIAILHAMFGAAWSANEYGFNPNALWDEITCFPNETLNIIWQDVSISREKFGKDADAVLRVLERFAKQYENVSFRTT